MVKKSARRTRRTHTPAFKAQVAFAALREDRTLAEVGKQLDLHASQITEWRRQLLENAAPKVCTTRDSSRSAPARMSMGSTVASQTASMRITAAAQAST